MILSIMMQKAMEIKGKKIAVLGLLPEGQKLVIYAANQGAEVMAAGIINETDKSNLQTKIKNLHWVEVDKNHQDLFQAEIWILTSQYHNFKTEVTKAQTQGIMVLSDLDFVCSQITNGKIVGITGTNGKSSTTHYLATLLRESGKKVFVGGNFFTDFVDALQDNYAYYLFEASSSALQRSKIFHPHVALLTSFAPNHPERHPSIEAYAQVKISITKNQNEKDYFIYNANAPKLLEILNQTSVQAKKLVCALETKVNPDITVSGTNIVYGSKWKINFTGKQLKGLQNIDNLMLAVTTANVLGLSAKQIEASIPKLIGLPHRFQRLGTFAGVEVIDDAAANTPASTAFALMSLKENVILICGGRWSNGLGHEALRKFLADHAKLCIVFGEARQRFADCWKDYVQLFTVETLDEAISLAFEKADRGDKLLFSPNTKPFKETGSYISLGEEFKKKVVELGEYFELRSKARMVKQ